MVEKNKVAELEDGCEHIVVDGAGHYCKVLCLPEPVEEYPHEYRRVMCYGKRDGTECRALRRRYALGDENEG